jgi:hypothetical protein
MMPMNTGFDDVLQVDLHVALFYLQIVSFPFPPQRPQSKIKFPQSINPDLINIHHVANIS